MPSQKDIIRIHAPATVANINCGFDTLGLALEGIGDTMVFKKTAQAGVKITAITGEKLPLATQDNVAGVAALAMLDAIDADFGVAIEIHKGIRCGSGIGSSAASAAGAVFGVNQFLESPLDNKQLTAFAMKGEVIASGQEHADNVAPCIYGGITLVTGYDPLHIVSLPVPDGLHIGILHPHITISTKAAREILPEKVPLKDAIKQSQYLSGFVTALYTKDKTLLAQSIKDVLIGPYRKQLLPHFEAIDAIAGTHGCFAFGISGSGPSLFAFAHNKEDIANYLRESKQLYTSQGLQVDAYASQINTDGCRIV